MRLSHLCAQAGLVAIAASLGAQTNSISLTAPGPLTISTATAGSPPAASTDQTARYSMTVVSGRMKVTAYVDTPPPAGVTLTLSLAAPSGAVSLGTLVLGTSPQDAVRYVCAGQYTGLTVTLTLTATVAAGIVPYNTSHVILTLASDP